MQKVVFSLSLALLSLAQSIASDAMLTNSNASARSLLWGTYRPNLYFGTKTRLPDSVITGLMWHGNTDLEGFKNIRHTCEHGDGLKSYGWVKHDGRTFGHQKIADPANNITFTTEFIKGSGIDHGTWALRVSGRALSPVAIYFYVALEGEGSLSVRNKVSNNGIEDDVPILDGNLANFGEFSIFLFDRSKIAPFPPPPSSSVKEMFADLRLTQVGAYDIPKSDSWKVKELLQQHLVQGAQYLASKISPLPNPQYLFSLRNDGKRQGNVVAFQKHVWEDFEFDIVFSSHTSGGQDHSSESVNSFTGDSLSEKLEESYSAFNSRFERIFGLSEKGFSAAQVDFAQAMMSNLLGGIGYFHGTQIVDRAMESVVENEPIDFIEEAAASDNEDDDYFESQEKDDRPTPKPRMEGPKSLFTAVPSRPFFPRGFLWDEGFHQLLVGTWDNDLSLEIISSWLELSDKNGWVGREQILGDEAASKVPKEFQTQYSHFGNPPTLLISIMQFADRLNQRETLKQVNVIQDIVDLPVFSDDTELLSDAHLANSELGRAFLIRAYKNFKKRYYWFRSTQWGLTDDFGRVSRSKEGYRWRGRTDSHTLTSGLDDYPRYSPAHPGELHIDLICWVGMMANNLKKMAEMLDQTADVQKFDRHSRNILMSLEDLHWNEDAKAYGDLSVDSEGNSVNVVHLGYMSLFPFILDLVPSDSPKIGDFLDLISSEEHLWSPYGLRSLSISSRFFGTGENYWRGPIWINMNYLVLRYLHSLSSANGAYKIAAGKIYDKLRKNIISTVFKEYKRTGFVWEQYSPEDGTGQRSHPFTGWTSLVVLIMAEKY